jgi:acylphosphatase
VGYRWFVTDLAGSLGLSGWVRNLADGGVEVHARGPRAILDDLLERLKAGPPGARVEGVEADWPEKGRKFEGFAILPTHGIGGRAGD